MTSTQSLAVVAGILIIIGIIIMIRMINYRQLKQLKDIEKQINDLEGLKLAEDIQRIDRMDLAGESLATFKQWQKVYKRSVEKVPALKEELSHASEENNTYRLLKAKRAIKEINAEMATLTTDLHNTKNVLTDLLKANRDNQIEYKSLIKQYHKMRKEILADSFEYGVAIDQIENELKLAESDFEASKNLSAQGDHVEAGRTLSKIKNLLSTLKRKLPQIKKERHELREIFPDQLAELSDTYKKMLSEKYAIHEVNVFDEIKSIHEGIDASIELLKSLDTNAVNSSNAELSMRIDSLYAILTKEFRARKFVEKDRDRVAKVIDRLQRLTKQLVDKLEHIDQSYELTHGELAESKKIKREVEKMAKSYQEDINNIDEGEGVYSEIKAKWLRMVARLNEIEGREKQISDDVDGLYEAENVANDSLAHFKEEVALIYRRVKRRHLPGNPESFIQIYTLVVNEIRHTSTELNQVRINMEKISEEMIQISDDVDRLQKDADEIINSANLTELTMQYSNKYLENNQIQKARKAAMALYQNKYDYKNALDTIAAALERVEPGAYQRLEASYYQEQKEKEVEGEE